MALRIAGSLVNIAHSRKFHELGHCRIQSNFPTSRFCRSFVPRQALVLACFDPQWPNLILQWLILPQVVGRKLYNYEQHLADAGV
jgi:hypothetical protein